MSSNALLKTLRCLETFQNLDGALSVKDIAGLTNDSVSSVQRCTYTLEVLGYLERETGGKRYVPGRMCLRPAYGYLRNNQLLETATPYLIDLFERLDARADLAVLEGTDIVYLARIPSRDELLNLSPLGQRWPAVNTSPGRAILAALPDEECDQLIERTKFKAFTPNTTLDPDQIRAEIKATRQLGYAYQQEEVLIGSSSVAAVIHGRGGHILGAIGIGGKVDRFAAIEQRRALGSAIVKVAQALSAHNL